MDRAKSADTASGPIVLVAVSAPVLLPSIHRVAAAAGLHVMEMTATTPPEWSSAALVVLDVYAATQRRGIVARRPGVVIVTDQPPTIGDWRAAAEIGAETVLGLPNDEPALMSAMGDRPTAASGGGAIVTVVGGCGGAGASTFASALACMAAQQNESAFLVDADHHGAGLDLTLGVERESGLRWSGLRVESGRVSAAALTDALPKTPSGVRVLACDRVGSRSYGPTPSSLHAVLDAARSSTPVTVCDSPRPGATLGDDVPDILFAESDLVVLIVPATVRAGVAAERTGARIAQCNPNVGLVVRGPAPGGLRAADVAAALDRPLLAAMRADRAVTAMLEHEGFRLRARSPLADAARVVLSKLSERPDRSVWAA